MESSHTHGQRLARCESSADTRRGSTQAFFQFAEICDTRGRDEV